jgi:MFS family permease
VDRLAADVRRQRPGLPVVGTAMPRIVASLNGLQHYAWVATGYLLASTASMPIWGKLSDAYGRKRFFILGMALFVTGSVLCGQSHSMTELIPSAPSRAWAPAP